MEDNRSFFCKAFPKALWWFLTLLGLPLIYLLMFNSNKDPIEDDLTKRVTDTLSAEGISWAGVDVDERGRDILLTGDAPSEEAKAEAVRLARGVNGVRVVDNDFNIAGLAATAAAVAGVGAAAVAQANDEAEVEKDKAPAEVVTQEADTEATSAAADSASANAKSANMTEPSKDMSIKTEFDDGKLVLTGVVATQEELDDIVKAVADRVGADNVVNNMEVDADTKPADWLAALPKLLALITPGGSMKFAENGIRYTGSAESQDAIDQILDNAEAALKTFHMPVLDNLIVDNVQVEDVVAMNLTRSDSAKEEEKPAEKATEDEPAPAAEPVADKATPVTEPAAETSETDPDPMPAPESEPVAKTKPAPASEPSTATKAVNLCQDKLNESMQGKVINFVTNGATIRRDSLPILDSIIDVMRECQAEISTNGVSINGHTDSRGSATYNMSLSLKRANAVKNYFVEKGVEASLLKSVGHGESSPIASNDTPEGQAANRRITFIIERNQ